jgi:hypothetical protein
MQISLNIKAKTTYHIAINISPHETLSLRMRESLSQQIASKILRATQCYVASGDI